MKWNRWYATRSYLRSSLWVVPLIALVLENVAIRLLFALHAWLEWIPWFGTTLTGASEALNTVETLTISFIVFTFGSMLVAIQVASGQLTPRIIATALLRNNVIRLTVGLFTGATNFQVSKRLFAMINNLLDSLPGSSPTSTRTRVEPVGHDTAEAPSPARRLSPCAPTRFSGIGRSLSAVEAIRILAY